MDKIVATLSNTQLSKWQLFNSLVSSSMKPSIVTIGGLGCTIQSIAKEDGSGDKFNLVVQHKGKDYKCYCRTTD